MAGAESTEEREANKAAKKRGWIAEKLQSLSRNGWPDRFYLKDGRHIFVEWKNPDDMSEPTEQQAKRHREIRAAGGEVYVWRTRQEAARVLR